MTGPLVLVIDDDADARDVYEIALKLEGFSVATARDGREGFTRAVELQPVLVITDLSMPGMGGLEMVRELRADPRTRHIAIITCSGQEERPQPDARVDAMLTKPCPLNLLLNEVQRVLRRAA
jgi:CheY-like chemotaxis protein